ncbi:MAG: hypothetical protein KHZ62_00715 [Clostridiales bacterium]|nr:hypothetical protein [Clostridiales bacterium]
MKITIYFVGVLVKGGKVICDIEVYLNGALEGWVGSGGKLKLKHVPEGENTLEFVVDYSKRKIRFTSSQNVKIWVKQLGFPDDRLDLFIKGEDVKVLEDETRKKKGFVEQMMGETEGKESLKDRFKKYL